MYRFNLLPRSNKPFAGPLQIARNSYKCDVSTHQVKRAEQLTIY